MMKSILITFAAALVMVLFVASTSVIGQTTTPTAAPTASPSPTTTIPEGAPSTGFGG